MGRAAGPRLRAAARDVAGGRSPAAAAMAAEAGGKGPSVLFLHPDLGLGGAERLVVDAALALQARGCRVQIWTAHYDPARCFAETRELVVRRCGSWLPRSLWGRGHALCAALRMAFVALYVLLLSDESADAFVCDQVPLPPFAAPLLRRGEAGGEAGGAGRLRGSWGSRRRRRLGCPPGSVWGSSVASCGLGGEGGFGGVAGRGEEGNWSRSKRPWGREFSLMRLWRGGGGGSWLAKRRLSGRVFEITCRHHCH